MMNNSEITSIINDWAKTKSRIKTVWLYGSRIKGNFSEDSDLDIAIKIESRLFDTDFDVYTCEGNIWQDELENLIPYKVDLQRHSDKNSPVDTIKVKRGVEEKSILIYQK